MVKEKTSLALWNSTLYKFNCAKVKDRFKTADDFLLFLLDFYAKNNKNNPNFTLKPMEKQKIYKPLIPLKVGKKKMEDNNNTPTQSMKAINQRALK